MGEPEPTTDHVTEDWQATLAADAVDTAVSSDDVVALFWYTNQDNPRARRQGGLLRAAPQRRDEEAVLVRLPRGSRTRLCPVGPAAAP